jgi:2-polyprenyl-3-methyl-5-hydroxy-6-metoxy-1,4-benzoquinol methylase
MKTAQTKFEMDNSSIEYVPCNLCRSDDPEPISYDGVLRLVRCRNCDLMYVSPRLKAQRVRALYNQDYFYAQDKLIENTRGFKGGYRDYIEDREDYLRTFRRRMREINKYNLKIGCLLDVGCAAGYFLVVAREEGWQVMGIEPSVYVADYARQQFGLDVFSGTLEEAILPAGSFDLVTIWDTLEHLPDPLNTLKHVNKLLSPEGYLVISTHNFNSLLARLMGKNWYQYGLHLHLYYFSPKTIRSLLTKTGFYVIKITKKSAGKYCNFRFLIDKFYNISRPLTKLIDHWFQRYPMLAKRAIYINPSDEMLIFAQKKP